MGADDSTTGLTGVDDDDDNDGIPDVDDAFPLDTTPLPDGISVTPMDVDSSGFRRTDNGDKHTNKDKDNGNPLGSVEYLFEIVLKDTSGSSPVTVRLILNGYSQEMVLDSGNLVDGALYSLPLSLGPAVSHNFYYEVRDDQEELVPPVLGLVQ